MGRMTAASHAELWRVSSGGIAAMDAADDLNAPSVRSPYTSGEGLAIIGHELRAPVTPLKMRLQQTRRRLAREGGRERDVEDLARALYHVERIQHQVAIFLDAGALMSGMFALVPRWTDLSEIALRLQASYASVCIGRSLRLKTPARPLTGFWDSSRLEMAVRELIGNALQYTTGDVTIYLRRRGRLTRVEVEDDGPGIPASARARIFEPYATGYESNHGLGLGLYVAREIVRAHGGQMGLRVPPGAGTRFWLTIPQGPAS